MADTVDQNSGRRRGRPKGSRNKNSFKKKQNYQQQGQKKHQCVRLAKGLATSQINEQ